MRDAFFSSGKRIHLRENQALPSRTDYFQND